MIFNAQLTILNNTVVPSSQSKSIFINGEELLLHEPFLKTISVGRAIIIIKDTDMIVCSLYLFDNNGMPFQIYGTNDVLAENSVIINDNTLDRQRQVAYANQVCFNAFSVIELTDIIKYKENFKLWERIVKEEIIHKKMGWKKSRISASIILENMTIPEYILLKMLRAIEICPKPVSLIHKHVKVCLDTYPNVSIT